MYIYIVLSQTGTVLARLIKLITRGEYSHASICLDDSYKVLYSFGRLNCYNPIFGGYIKESPDYGTFKRFHKTKVCIMRMKVSEPLYQEMKAYLEEMYENRKHYKYNYIGLFLAAFNRGFHLKNRFYCSEFVGDVLTHFHIVEEGRWGKLVKPMDLSQLPGTDVMYTGQFSVFAEQA